MNIYEYVSTEHILVFLSALYLYPLSLLTFYSDNLFIYSTSVKS